MLPVCLTSTVMCPKSIKLPPVPPGMLPWALKKNKKICTVKKHCVFLRFTFCGTTYKYMVLPFSLSLSPRVLVKCTEAAVAPLRKQGVRIAMYINDWLLAA